jgi:glycosyltransferase involved in cell wall biosynthesis
MILKGYPRISETFISNEILLLEKMGFCVHLFSMRQPRENYSHASVKQIKAAVDYLPQTLLAPLPKFLYHNLRLAVRHPVRYAGALQTACRRFARTRKSATFKHLLQAGYLVQRFLPRSRVSHLHAHFAHSPTSVAMFASQLSGLPFSFTAHAKDIYTSNRDQLREKIKLARFVATCTEYNRRYLSRLSEGADTPIHRVYHGIDVNLFSNGDAAQNGNKSPFRILTVARLIEKKGLPTVYRALKILVERGLAIKHTLVGDGDDRDKTLDLIDRLGLGDTAEWVGTKPHETVLEYYRRAHLFVLGCQVASNGDRDGIPNVLLESMAMGVPVVATDVSAIPELVESGRTGLLVSPQQPEKMADAIEQMLTDQELRRNVIPAARERVAREFDNRLLIKDLVEIYRRELSGARKTHSYKWFENPI